MSEAARVGEKKPAQTATYTAKAYAATNATEPFEPFTIRRRVPQPEDVQIEILFCGVCHSDLHLARNEWESSMPATYPVVPGHEIVGRVVKVGRAVKKFREGDFAAVGCMVDSCRKCASCRDGEEQYCEVGMTLTYNSPDQFLGGVTYGGYSESIVVDEAYVLRVSNKVDLAGTAPLLCAGITTYSPLRHWKVHRGMKVGIVGLGGLGHLGVKFAHSFGAHVVLFTTSPSKSADARRLGADEVVISRNFKEMQQHAMSFDFILDAVSAQHDLNAYLQLLKRNGTMVLVGASPEGLPVNAFNLIMGRHQLAGSGIGGIRETQEMLDYCAEHGITSDVERIPIQDIDAAYGRMLKGDVRYRFVIDIESLRRG
jgi:alcohol dehydrogenase (NADP+)